MVYFLVNYIITVSGTVLWGGLVVTCQIQVQKCQYVSYNGVCSSPKLFTCYVPQGSIHAWAGRGGQAMSVSDWILHMSFLCNLSAPSVFPNNEDNN